MLDTQWVTLFIPDQDPKIDPTQSLLSRNFLPLIQSSVNSESGKLDVHKCLMN